MLNPSLLESAGRALLVGGAGRFPFNGHLRQKVVGESGAVLYAAARVAASYPPPETWPAVMTLYRVLAHTKGKDKVELSRNFWDLLATVPTEKLGPADGKDLTILLVAEDSEGLLISGVGIGGLLGVVDPKARPVVPPTHPLLSETGLPQGPPRALSPKMTAPAYIAWCHGDPPVDASVETLYAKCGVRA